MPVCILTDKDYEEEVQPGFNSSQSPNDLVRARSHEDLSGRKEAPAASGLSLREPLNTRDYWNWE